MSEFQASNFKKENGGTPDLLGKTELTSPYFFVPPSGTTAERPESCGAGTLRFNTDIGTLEVYRGDGIGWEQIQRRDDQYLGGGTGSNTGTGTRGLLAGGYANPYKNTVDFITIPTLGNAEDFGDQNGAAAYGATTSDTTRGLVAGGHGDNPRGTVIDFFTISQKGNSTDFGDLTVSRWLMGGGCSSSTRSIFTAGSQLTSGNPAINTLDYVTTQSLGNAVDFGDSGKRRAQSSVNSSTRGIWAGGYDHPAESGNNTIEFVTMASTGNTTDFGDLTEQAREMAGMCNSTRGVFAGNSNPFTNTMSFVTIATTGNSIDFGDGSVVRGLPGAVSSPTRGVICGGTPNHSSYLASMEFIEIATTGNSSAFGDLTEGRHGMGGISNGHGGL